MNTEQAVHAKIRRKGQFIGGGCLVQALGFLLAPVLFFFFPPVGFVLAALFLIAMLIWGSRLSVSYRCGNCGNPVADKNVKVCPTCKAVLHA